MKLAALMIIVKDGKILCVSRGVGSPLWALPGGKREPDETAELNAIRETFEETGIVVSKATHVYAELVKAGSSDGSDFYSDCYFADEWSGSIVPSDEGDVEWLAIEELLEKAAFKDHNEKLFKTFKEKFENVEVG